MDDGCMVTSARLELASNPSEGYVLSVGRRSHGGGRWIRTTNRCRLGHPLLVLANILAYPPRESRKVESNHYLTVFSGALRPPGLFRDWNRTRPSGQPGAAASVPGMKVDASMGGIPRRPFVRGEGIEPPRRLRVKEVLFRLGQPRIHLISMSSSGRCQEAAARRFRTTRGRAPNETSKQSQHRPRWSGVCGSSQHTLVMISGISASHCSQSIRAP